MNAMDYDIKLFSDGSFFVVLKGAIDDNLFLKGLKKVARKLHYDLNYDMAPKGKYIDVPKKVLKSFKPWADKVMKEIKQEVWKDGYRLLGWDLKSGAIKFTEDKVHAKFYLAGTWLKIE